MIMYKLIGKLVNKTGKIVGYRLKGSNLKEINVTKVKALSNSDLIINAKVKGKYLVLVNNKTSELPTFLINEQNKILGLETSPIILSPQKKKFRDFSNWGIGPLMLEGVADKFMVINPETQEKYILKFGRYDATKDIQICDYISEYIGCKIAKKLGYSVQEVELGYYNGRECVVVKFFGQVPITFKGLGYSTVNGEKLHTRDERYDLDWLLGLKMSNKFAISQTKYTDWVWSVFFLDMFIGNYDRHEGNWGFLKQGNKKIPSPLFDMGASLFSREMNNVINWDDGKIKNEIETRVRSSVLYKGKKRGYFQLLEIYTKNKDVKMKLISFINNVEKNIDSFEDIYAVVKEYNKKYSCYAIFINKMLRMKIKLLRRFIK